MAKKTVTQTTYTDDLDGSSAAGTVAFSVDGTSYEIDLSKRNAAAFEKALKPYVDNARKVKATRAKAAARATPKRDLAVVRQWAKSNGYEVSDRGRVASVVIEAYDAAR